MATAFQGYGPRDRHRFGGVGKVFLDGTYVAESIHWPVDILVPDLGYSSLMLQ